MEDSVDKNEKVMHMTIGAWLEKMTEDELGRLQTVLYRHCTSANGCLDENISDLLECVERMQTLF